MKNILSRLAAASRFTPVAALALVVAGLQAPVAQAQVWQSAPTLKEGGTAVGGFGQFFFESSEFQIAGQLAYGLAPRLQGEVRLGFGTVDFYAGGFLKYYLAAGKIADVSVWGGIYTLGSGGMDVAAIFSHQFERFGLYVAPRLVIPLAGGDLGMSLNPGFHLGVGHSLAFYAEVSLNLTNTGNSAAFGLRYFL